MMSKDDPTPLRLAVISTPRSGNTWMRSLLAGLYGLEPIGLHDAAAIDWESLPARCVIQIHWAPWPRFVRRLERYGFRVVVMARHPLDVLMSWLNYAYYVHEESYCPGAGACRECAIVGVLPRSEAFLDYLRSDAGRLLLSYSPAWWLRAGMLRVRYEDLLADPGGVLARLCDEIGEAPTRPIDEVVRASSSRERKPSRDAWQYHFWQGQPGLWRRMLPPAEARAIAAIHPYVFEFLGYECDPDESLDPARADRNWLELQVGSTREHLRLERAKGRRLADDLAAALRSGRDEHERHKATWVDRDRLREAFDARQAALEETDRALAEASRELADADRAVEALRAQLEAADRRLASFEEIAPGLLAIARKLTRLAAPSPRPGPTAKPPRAHLPRPHLLARRSPAPREPG